MKYILSEEEYNTLQSRIQFLESANRELKRDLAGTERELRRLKADNHAFNCVLAAKDREIAKLTQKSPDSAYEAASKAFLEVIKSGL